MFVQSMMIGICFQTHVLVFQVEEALTIDFEDVKKELVPINFAINVF